MPGNRKKVKNFSFRQFAEMKMFSATYFRNWKKSRKCEEGRNFHFILHYRFCWTLGTYIFSNATLPRFLHFLHRSTHFQISSAKNEILYFLSLALFCCLFFILFFIREKQQRISMYAYIYLILKIRGWNNIRLEKK